jgi:hypothetical protein
MDIQNHLEKSKWLYARIYVLYDDTVKIGYTVTEKEADMICEKHPHLQWNRSKHIDLINQLEQMTIHDKF